MSDKHRLAIVGCGGHARFNLATHWETIPAIEPVGACDVNPESVASFAEAYGIKNAYTDLSTMLSEQKPDILIVASWPSSHMENVLEGVRGGVRAIFCEKPFALNATQASEMVQAAKSANVILMEGFMFRYHPQTLAVKQRLDEGAVGDIRYMRATFSSGSGNRTNWRQRHELGGGAAMDLGCYCLSGLRCLLGEPLSVSVTGQFDPIGEIWKTLIGTLHFEDGVIGQFDCSFGWPRRGSFEVVGDKGSLIVPRSAWSWPREIESSFSVSHSDHSRIQFEETIKITGAAECVHRPTDGIAI